MCVCLFVTFAMFAGLSVADDKSQPDGHPLDGELFNDPHKTNSRRFGPFDESSNSNSDSFNSFADHDEGNSGNFGLSNNPVCEKFGREGLSVNEMVKSDAPAFESSVQKEIREMVVSRKRIELQLPVDQKAAYKTTYRTDDWKCKFAGDDNLSSGAYCDTIFASLRPTANFVVTYTYGKIDVTGSTATVRLIGHAKGYLPVIGVEVNYISKFDEVLVLKDGEWKHAQSIMKGDNAGTRWETFKSKFKKRLRDSIYSAKQQYPAYNPIVIVGGSAVAGLLALVIVGVWIIRKRRSYEEVNTVAGV